MAGGNTYGVGAVTVHGDAKTDIISLRLGKQGTIQGFGSDGDLWQKLRWAEDLFVNGEYESTDVDGAKALTPGDKGTIVFTFRKRLGGSGYGASIVATVSNAVIEPFDMRVPHSGVSGVTVPFSAYSSDGATSPVAFA